MQSPPHDETNMIARPVNSGGSGHRAVPASFVGQSAILTIAYVIAVCAIVWLGHCHELAIHAADQRERDETECLEGEIG